MAIYSQYVRFTPVGEYLRLIILRRLARGPVSVEEVNELAKKAVEKLGIRYDWRVWPKLLEGEVEIRDGTAAITQRGRWILEQTSEEVAKYVEKTLGVSL
jgi:hypothetical protein